MSTIQLRLKCCYHKVYKSPKCPLFTENKCFLQLKKMNKKMNAKKILVSLFAIASILLLAASASAYTVTGDFTVPNVEVDRVSVNDAVVLGGDTISLRIEFTANLSNYLTDTIDNDDDGTVDEADEIDVPASNIRIRAELEGNEGSATAVVSDFDVEDGKTYVKTLTMKVPQVDDDEVSEDLTLNLKIWNADFETEVEGTLLAQRVPYTAKVVSVNVDNSLKAGEVFPVEVVLRNTGYNDLEDVYVTVKIEALGVEKTAYFGDIVNVKNVDKDKDDVDTVSGKVYLTLPYDVAEGKYSLEVVVKTDDATVTETSEVFVTNSFPAEVMKVANGLLLVNPSTELRMYKIVTATSEEIVSVQAGTSKTVDVNATSNEYTVTVLRMNGEVVETFTFENSGQLIVNGSPVVVLTAILAVVFLILVVVLVVLMTKKPKKSEDSESYY